MSNDKPTTINKNTNFLEPLLPGKQKNTFITHDGVEAHASGIIVRLLTRKPTHAPFGSPYANVARVLNDSPQEFHDYYEWLAVSANYNGKELTIKELHDTVTEVDGKFFNRCEYYDINGDLVERMVPCVINDISPAVQATPPEPTK